MEERIEINRLVNIYCRLRDRQRAVYDRCAKRHGLTVKEVEKDRRCKRIRFTQKGLQYAGEVIPAAARAENIAMAKLNVTTAAELVRLTEIFTKNMEIAFAETEEQK